MPVGSAGDFGWPKLPRRPLVPLRQPPGEANQASQRAPAR